MWFMHLNHEVKFFKYVVLVPYLIFMSYTIFIVLDEGIYSGHAENRTKVDPILVKQQEDLKSGHGHHAAGAEHGAEHAEEAHH